MSYSEKVERELDRWERRISRPPSYGGKLTKGWQNKINEKIPERVHQAVSNSIKQMVRATIAGSDYLSNQPQMDHLPLEKQEEVLLERVVYYKRTAAVEGATTGAGGIFLGLADFPLLVSIKMKFLFDAAKIYGYDTEDYRERLFLLTIFQLAFSKDSKQREVLEKIKNWNRHMVTLPAKENYLEAVDWKTFQLEYRDFIDLPKTLQLIPGFGAIVGAVANYKYLDVLADHAKNSFRHRILKQNGSDY